MASPPDRICPHCGHSVATGWTIICDQCHGPLGGRPITLHADSGDALEPDTDDGSDWVEEPHWDDDPAPQPATLIRLYVGKQQEDAAAAFQVEAARLAAQGYYPVGQSWAAGQWGCGAWLFALVLCIFLIGILVFIYMLIVKPDGTLTVTDTLRDHDQLAQPAAQEVPSASELPGVQATSPLSLAARLAQLDEARAAGLITEDEYQKRRSVVIESV
jgi:uncharacterized membrane protein